MEKKVIVVNTDIGTKVDVVLHFDDGGHGCKIYLDENEARALYLELHKVFGEKPVIIDECKEVTETEFKELLNRNL